MAAVHVSGDGHVAPLASTAWQYLPYSDADNKKVVDQALFILRNNVRGMKPCNGCFSKLPGGKSFDDILDDPGVFIHFDPGNVQGRYGATRNGTKNVTISLFSIRMGRWTVAATLVHEFAHVNGAPDNTHDAEATLNCCGFGALHNPNIIGAAPQQPSNTAYA